MVGCHAPAARDGDVHAAADAGFAVSGQKVRCGGGTPLSVDTRQKVLGTLDPLDILGTYYMCGHVLIAWKHLQRTS